MIRKGIGIVFIIIALSTFILFITRTEFSIYLQDWISLSYYLQFSPYFISIMLFYSGAYLYRKDPKSNFAMAVFGYTIFELFILSWLGLSPNSLGTYPTLLLGFCALAAVWIAHRNSFNLKILSLKEILISMLIGALESFLLYQLQLN